MSDIGDSTGAGEKRAALLTLGFGTTVGMWALLYVARFVPGLMPSWPLLILLLLSLMAGGYFAGRWAAWGFMGGAAVGLVSSLLNLLILGSLLGRAGGGGLRAAAAAWIPGSLLAGTLLAGLGAALGSRRGAPRTPDWAWNGALAGVAAAATLMLVSAGGLVTSQEAGLAVPDWPNSEGFNMFLFPLARMTGGVFYEHAHRLLGSLLGLTVLVLALHLQGAETRRGVKAAVWLIFLAVVLQGLLGGLRVTGRFTLSQEAAELAPSTALAIVHGILGQGILAGLLGLAAVLTRRWRSDLIPEESSSADTERLLSKLFIIFLLVQIALGALLRHLSWGSMAHVSFAIFVLLIGIAAGVRAWGFYPRQPEIRRLGRFLVIAVGLQILLGTGALIAVNATPESGDVPAWEVALATAHQVTGALLLGGAALLACWVRRLLLVPMEE